MDKLRVSKHKIVDVEQKEKEAKATQKEAEDWLRQREKEIVEES